MFGSGSSYSSSASSKNTVNKSVEQIRRELETNNKPEEKKKLSIDELLQQSIDSDSSDEESDVESNTGKSKSSVEDLLAEYDDDDDDIPMSEASTSDKVSSTDGVDAKVPLRLSSRQRKILAKQDIPELAKLLESVDIQPLSEEDDLRDACIALLKNLSKKEQKEAVYTIVGTPDVETVDPEEDFFEDIYNLDGTKLKKLHDLLADTNILGRVSTAKGASVDGGEV